MREYALDFDDLFQFRQPMLQRLYVVAGESEAVHACVEFNMYGIGGRRRRVEPEERISETVEYAERIDIGLQPVADNHVKPCLFRVHDHNGEGDAVAAQFNAFIDIGNGEIVDMIMLQCSGDLNSTGTIGGGFDHSHQTCALMEPGTEVVQIMHKGIEVDLHESLMAATLQLMGDTLEPEPAGTFEEHRLVAEERSIEMTQKVVGRRIKRSLFYRGKAGLAAHKCRAYTDKGMHATPKHHVGHLTIECLLWNTRLWDVADDDGTAVVLLLLQEEIEGNIEGSDIERVAIVDDKTVVDTLDDFETHLDGSKMSATRLYLLRCITEEGHHGDAMECVLL